MDICVRGWQVCVSFSSCTEETRIQCRDVPNEGRRQVRGFELSTRAYSDARLSTKYGILLTELQAATRAARCVRGI